MTVTFRLVVSLLFAILMVKCEPNYYYPSYYQQQQQQPQPPVQQQQQQYVTGQRPVTSVASSKQIVQYPNRNVQQQMPVVANQNQQYIQQQQALLQNKLQQYYPQQPARYVYQQQQQLPYGYQYADANQQPAYYTPQYQYQPQQQHQYANAYGYYYNLPQQYPVTHHHDPMTETMDLFEKLLPKILSNKFRKTFAPVVDDDDNANAADRAIENERRREREEARNSAKCKSDHMYVDGKCKRLNVYRVSFE